MFNLVIDLEMCKVPKYYGDKCYKHSSEIIQIGAVLLDENFKRVATLSQYVHPEYGVINRFIENLTGIKNSQVKKAPKLEEALSYMLAWLGKREYKIYTWSSTDRIQLIDEIKAKKIENIDIDIFMEEDKWIDYQDIVKKRFELTRQLSLEEALERSDIQVFGRLHNGLDDAINTGYLIEKLELNPNYNLYNYEIKQDEPIVLGYTIGDLLKNLDFNFT